MSTLVEIENTIQAFEKERIIMKVEQFDKLLKRVNFEEDTEVKQGIISAIHKYLEVFAVEGVQVANVEAPDFNIERAIDDIVPSATKEIQEPVSVEETTSEVVEAPAVQETTNEEVKQQEVVTEPVVVEEQAESAEELQEEMNLEVEEVKVETQPAPVIEEAPVAEVKEEVKAEVSAETQPVDETEYVETFGLISPTNDKHLDTIIERGGVMFREKRSFTLVLCLDDEVVAIAKTIKLEQFPQHVQDHLKNNGFISVQVVSFSEITKKSRARYTDVTYKNLQLLDNDHWIVKNVTNLLEKGEVPEHAKEKEEESTKETAVAEQKSEEVTAQSEAQPVQEEATTEEKPFLVTSFLIHPNFVEIFKNQKDVVVQQPYGITCANGTARFFTKNGSGTVVIGIDEKSPLKPNNYSAKILDYTIKEANGNTFIQFKLDAEVIGETVQAPPVTQEQPAKPAVQLQAQGEVPADFPATDKLELVLHPKAEAMFSLEAAKAMVGQSLSLGFYHSPSDNANRIALMYDVFEMAATENILSKQQMRNSKWVARLTDVDLVTDESTQRKKLVVKFDYLIEVDAFPYENKDEVLDVTSFAPITEDAFAYRQRELAQKQEEAKAASQPVQPTEEVQPVNTQESTQPATEQTVSAEQVLNKDYNPEQAKQLLEPNPQANYAQGYQELVTSQSKDPGGAVQEIRNQTALTPQDRQNVLDQAQGAITGVITQTLKETGIHTQTEEKQTTQVVGNIQDGSGNLSETETVIQFTTGFPPVSWQKSVGKRVQVVSELQMNGGPITSKVVSILGKEGQIVAQGLASMTEAVLLDGKQHEATILEVVNFSQAQVGHVVTMRLGNFNKIA